MTYEQRAGLEPMPNGTVVCMVNPYDRTYYFERQTDWGPEPCDPPEGYVAKDGWTLKR